MFRMSIHYSDSLFLFLITVDRSQTLSLPSNEVENCNVHVEAIYEDGTVVSSEPVAVECSKLDYISITHIVY